ncbi:MAG TPA: 50S ribosomal protein L6 [Actinomycetota bacterium]|nr:50S ribosomal protein L6 [Actinomycetota bacterium]
MSRIGQAPIEIPSGVQVSVTVGRITVNGPRGELQRVLPEDVTVEVVDSEVRVSRIKENREVKALHGLVRSLIANMVQGVTQGYEKALEIHGVGYRAAKQGTSLEIQVGFSHPVKKDAPKGIEFDVPAPTRIVVKGIDKELVGQVAAEIRSIRKPEPYKAKGIRYEGEYVRRKSGKAAKAIGA